MKNFKVELMITMTMKPCPAPPVASSLRLHYGVIYHHSPCFIHYACYSLSLSNYYNYNFISPKISVLTRRNQKRRKKKNTSGTLSVRLNSHGNVDYFKSRQLKNTQTSKHGIRKRLVTPVRHINGLPNTRLNQNNTELDIITQKHNTINEKHTKRHAKRQHNLHIKQK